MNQNTTFLKEVKEIKNKIKILKVKINKKNKKLVKISQNSSKYFLFKNLIQKAYNLSHMIKQKLYLQ